MARPRGDNLTSAEAAVFRKVIRRGLERDGLTHEDLLEADHLGDLKPKDDRWISNALTGGRVVSRKMAYDIWQRYYRNQKSNPALSWGEMTLEEGCMFDSSIYEPGCKAWYFEMARPKIEVTVEINTLASDMAACAARRPSAAETKLKPIVRFTKRFVDLLRSKCVELDPALVNFPTETCHQCGAVVDCMSL